MTIAPGWYADPHNTAQLRWWDGAQWTPQAMAHPGTGPVAGSGYAPQPTPGYPGRLQMAAPHSFFARNRNSVLAAGVAIAYGIIAVFAHFVFLGIVPIFLTVNAFRAKEAYAVVALVLTVAALGVSVFTLTR